jgi:hypothetical protein
MFPFFAPDIFFDGRIWHGPIVVRRKLIPFCRHAYSLPQQTNPGRQGIPVQNEAAQR